MFLESIQGTKKGLQTRVLFFILCIAFGIATIAFFTHALEKNPQFDTQGIRYGGELIDAIEKNKAWEWLTQLPARKYPLLYIIPFSLGYEVLAFLRGGLDHVTLPHIHLTARIVTLLYSIGTILFLVLTARRLRLSQTDALLLLFSSVLFFLFTTAVRPHGAVMFWTLVTYYSSLHVQDKPSARWTVLSFASAACALATLQSGIFAFFFPLWAVCTQSRSVKNKSIGLTYAIFFGIAGALIGYPFLLQGIQHTQTGAVDVSMGHDIGFDFRLQLVPIKLWMLFNSELILWIFGIIGIVQLFKKRDILKNPLLPAICYCILFLAVFAGHSITATRFFLPLFPLLALLGVHAFSVFPRFTRPVLTVFLILLYVKLAFLGFRPDTFEQASAFMRDKPGTIATAVPSYFLTIPPERFIQKQEELPEASFIVTDQEESVRNFPICATFVSSRYAFLFAENRSPFLWNAVEWPLVFVFETRTLGPNLFVHCKS